MKEKDQPATKRRKLETGYKRVVQEEKQPGKRQGGEEEVYDIFKKTKYQKRDIQEFEEYLNDKEREANTETEPDKSEEEMQKEWEALVAEIEERMRREEEEREQRQRKAMRLQQSYDLLRLCKHAMEKEGLNWEKSKERREYERGKAERMHIVEMRKNVIKDKVEKDRLQEKITESLARRVSY